VTDESSFAKSALIIAGPIGVGKSAVTDWLRSQYGWDVVSFGRYVQAMAEKQKLGSSRDVLQRLGQELIETRGPRRFLLDAVQWNQPESDVLLFDGVRHRAVLTSIRETHCRVVVIFLHASAEARFQRFVDRGRSTDSMNIGVQEFVALTSMGVEAEISSLEELADAGVDANQEFNAVLAQVTSVLRQHDFV
jgi:dephospho-CoA kinase